jgi:Flp pilus assembly protein TadD
MRYNRISWLRIRRPGLVLALCCAVLSGAAAASSPQTDSGSLLRKADQYVDQGKTNLARRTYEQALRAGARLNDDFQRSRNLGLVYLDSAPPEYQPAIRWLQNAVRLRPGDDDTRLWLARALSWKRDFQQAADQYHALQLKHPDNPDYAIGYADALYGTGAAGDSLSSLASFLERNPGSTDVHLAYARFLGYARRYVEADSEFEHVLQAEPQNLRAQLGLAKVYSWQEQYAAALRLLDAVLKREPGNYDAVVAKGFTLLWMGRKSEARQLFVEAAQRKPDDQEVAKALRSLPAKHIASSKNLPVAPGPGSSPQRSQPRPATPEATTKATSAEKSNPTAPSTRADPIASETAAAESALARNDYADAVLHYRGALQQDAADRSVRLQLARVLSWSKEYPDSLTEYDALLRAHPDDRQIRLEKARVLSWARRYDDSLAEYKSLLSEPGKDGTEAVTARDVRLEYARVLSWSGKYNQSLHQLALLLPRDKNPTAEDKPVLSQRALVLGWSGQYDQAIRTWDEVLAFGDDFKARLGKAQTLYWAGRLSEARLQLQQLRNQQPGNPEVNFTLAAVERGLGWRGEALTLLRLAPQDEETKKLRLAINEELRPVLRLRFGFEDDREQLPSGFAVGLKQLRYGAALEFNLRPDLRMRVSNTVTHGLTSDSVLAQFGSDAWSTSTMAGVSFTAARWLRIYAGAGDGSAAAATVAGTQTERRHHFLYEIRPTIEHHGVRFSFAATRQLADYTALAIHNDAVQTREGLAAEYTFRHLLRLAADYWHANYALRVPGNSPQTFDTAANGGSLAPTILLKRGEKLSIDSGVRYEIFSFDDSAARAVVAAQSTGFFTPRVYERIAWTGHLRAQPTRYLDIDLNGTLGPQRVFGFQALNPPPAEFRNTGTVGTQFTFKLGRWTPFLAYDFYSTATAAFPGSQTVLQNGSYRSQSVVIGLNRRF